MSRQKLQPYPGLRPFERYESRTFFGRQQQVDELLARLKQHHFLAVIGASGSGKSSLVKAGMLPGLEKGYMGEVGSRWSIAEMRPGEQPFVRVAEALLRDKAFREAWQSASTPPTPEKHATEAEIPSLTAELRRGSLSLHEILELSPLPEGTRLLLLIDQFEEIFRFRELEENQAAAFVSLLLAACRHRDIYVVITMRSDFLGAAVEFHGLPEAINSGLYLTPRLTREQLREAICLPAQLFGGSVEDALANHLLNEAGNDPDQLPLLQHALMRMWEGDEDKILTLAEYQGLNDLRRALDGHAEQIWKEIDTAGQAIAEAMFRALTERSRDGQFIRRPLKMRTLLEMTATDLPTLTGIVDVFRQSGRNFLMPPPHVPLTPDTTLDISHESLIRQWRRLQEWVKAEGEKAAMYQRLLDSAQRHADGQGELWHRTDLALALEWRAGTQPNAVWAERYGEALSSDSMLHVVNEESSNFGLAMQFLRLSEAEAEAQRQQQEMEVRRKSELSQMRLRFMLVFGGFIIAAGLAGWGFVERDHAEVAKEKALKETARAIKAEEIAKNNLGQADAARKVAKEETERAIKAEERARKAEKHQARLTAEAEGQVKVLGRRLQSESQSSIAIAEVTLFGLIKQNGNGLRESIRDILKGGHRNALLSLLKSLLDQSERLNYNERQDRRDALPAMTDEQIVKLVEILFDEKKELFDIKGNYDSTEKRYRQRMDAAPKDADNLGNYAVFMKNIRKDYDRAERLYEQAIAADPKNSNNLSNFALFMQYIRKDYGRAENLYQQAIAADPKDAYNLGRFAVFMKNIRKDYVRAETLYQQAIAADPKNSNNLSNFASFMQYIRKDYGRAENLYQQAIAADPEDANSLGDFAIFMKNIRKDYDRAEKLYQQAVAAAPKHANNLGNFAIFMQTIRKDNDRAEKLYQQAIAVAPMHANSLANYAQLKLASGNHKEGRALIEQSFAANPVEPEIKLELWFYRLAHFPQDYPRAQKEIVALLKTGARDEGWDFSGNIAQAEKDRHANVALLKALSDVILDKAKFETLTPFLGK